MKFHLYECIIKRKDSEIRGHIVAPSKDRAWMVAVEHEEALGLEHDDLTLTRVDKTLGSDRRLGLDTLLESAPVGLASWCEIGWVAHIAPVQQLKLYRLVQDGAGDLFAIAPNIDIAASVFTTALRGQIGEMRMLHIVDGIKDLPDDEVRNLPQLLEFGPIGVAHFDGDEKRWFMV